MSMFDNRGRERRLSKTPNPFGSLATIPKHPPEVGCQMPHHLPRTFGDLKDLPANLQALPPASVRVAVAENEKKAVYAEPVHPEDIPRGCKYMADDIVIELFEEEKRRTREMTQDAGAKRPQEEEEKRKTISKGKVKGRYKNVLMATKMNRFLNQTTAAHQTKMAAKVNAQNTTSVMNADGSSRLPRPFEDPLIRLQRQMTHENKDHYMLLHQRLLDLWYYKTLCDVNLKTCDGVFQVHSCLLATHCGFWMDFCENRHTDGCQVTLPLEIDFRKNVSGIGLRTVIHYLYTGRIKVGHENCVEVFDAARTLKIRDLTYLTERFIKVLLQDHNLWSTVSATKNTTSAIFDIAWTKLATRFVRLCKTDAFCQVELGDLLWFLRSDELLVTSELQVFEAAMNWIRFDKMIRMKDFRTIMDVIRFAYMTTDELVQCVKYDPIFLDEIGIDILSGANLAKVFANENQEWSGFALHEARRPEFGAKLKKFFSPDGRTLLEEELKIKQLDAQVSTNSLDLGKLFDKKHGEHIGIR